MGGPATIREFSPDGIPYSYTARMRERFISPFYVVHYGLIYSDNCISNKNESSYHWRLDSSRKYWPFPPGVSSIDQFRTSADWVIDNIKSDKSGNAHLFYDFDWPYQFYPGGKLEAPWWSGLTDAHAITLLLRAKDCFGDEAYLSVATALYRSVLTPVSRGGSLVLLDGYPWIEEYVDSRVPEEKLSRVFNGMVYAYHGIRAYEEYTKSGDMADKLLESIYNNFSKYDAGYWTRYDQNGSITNIKYNTITYNILKDSRIYNEIFDEYLSRWKIGIEFPGFLYPWCGPKSIAKTHFIVTFIMVFVISTLFVYLVLGLLRPARCIRRD
ncbi:D-glucuronyl C5-epimerase family protein [Hyphomicrobium sp. DMF-1]|jgi:hypothetical protein|uniref:D-glucuronyl C5-epimerase family protein n=1 Tax=Hyphomicrobium sp. DMF-1 TaxID=3019544 RepID=UPI0022EBA999|nr:D-glucuronyl C5-epimerase family protein [Hyphomicrobium sp. DMF-1]WBT38290.1 D-glucuronyl C5-epimerase family protein [Hyphomicrobium sp. DMF-1]